MAWLKSLGLLGVSLDTELLVWRMRINFITAAVTLTSLWKELKFSQTRSGFSFIMVRHQSLVHTCAFHFLSALLILVV